MCNYKSNVTKMSLANQANLEYIIVIDNDVSIYQISLFWIKMPNQTIEVYFVCLVLLLVTSISIGIVVLKIESQSKRNSEANKREILLMSDAFYNEFHSMLTTEKVRKSENSEISSPRKILKPYQQIEKFWKKIRQIIWRIRNILKYKQNFMKYFYL